MFPMPSAISNKLSAHEGVIGLHLLGGCFKKHKYHNKPWNGDCIPAAGEANADSVNETHGKQKQHIEPR